MSDFVDEKGRFWAKIQLLNRANFGKMRHLGMIFKHYGYPGNPIGGHLSNLPLFFLLLCSSSGNRNCLLCDNNVVKITDVAMGISLFNSDYSEVRGRSCAPIRWQPWETLLLVSNVVMQSGMHP